MSDSAEVELDQITKKTQIDGWTTLLPDQVSQLVHAFLPSRPSSLRTKAYIALSAVCQRLRNHSSSNDKEPDAAIEATRRLFGPPVSSRLSDTTEGEVLAGTSFLTALFEVDWQAASSIFREEGTVESVSDALDLFSGSALIERAMAHLLAQASGHKSCRALISSQHTQWLTKLSRRTEDNSLRAAAAVALVKLSRGAGADAAEVVGSQTQAPTTTADDDLVRMMTRLVVSGDDTSLADAIEGLAYMSTDPHVKEMLVDDSPFLKRLFSVIPRRKGSAALLLEDTTKSPVYGVSVIIHNLCAYRPRLTEEQAQVVKLRRMAKAQSSSGTPQELEADPSDDDEHVKARGRKLVSCGVLDALTAAVRATDSRAVRLTVGKALLGLIEDKDNRGKVLQAGGAKALTLIIIGVLPSTKSSQSLQSLQLDASDIEPMQALAKLAITASPLQVFGPNEGALYDAVRPFALMLVHPSANLLQRFEALMALTNLASSGGAVASRIAQADGLLNKVEMLMLEEHVLVRRAATELICNLVGGCEDVWTRYGGTKAPGAKSRLQVLAALCDVEDVPTRMAAAGALAVVSASPDACELLLELQRERHRVLPILGQLVDPGVVSPPPVGDDVEPDDDEERESPVSDPGLVHRGVVCILNLFMVVREPAKRTELATEADRIGIVRALVDVVKSSPSNSPALRPAAEAIKWLLGSGVEVTI